MTETKNILIMPNPDKAAQALKEKLSRERGIRPERFKQVKKVGQYGDHTGAELDEAAKKGGTSTQAGHIGEALDEK